MITDGIGLHSILLPLFGVKCNLGKVKLETFSWSEVTPHVGMRHAGCLWDISGAAGCFVCFMCLNAQFAGRRGSHN